MLFSARYRGRPRQYLRGLDHLDRKTTLRGGCKERGIVLMRDGAIGIDPRAIDSMGRRL
jgi:hypothetical protein